MSFTPTHLGGFCRDLRSFAATEFRGSSMTAFKTAETPESDGSGIFDGFCGGYELWCLAGRFEHDLISKLIHVAGTLL
jgi:hypothetical protein